MANKTVYPYGQGGSLPAGYPIVDDCETDRADVALSARQGMILAGHHSEPLPVDLSSKTKYNYGIGSNNKWVQANGTTNKSKCILIDLSGAKSVNLETSGGGVYIAFLNSSNMSDGTTPDYSSGYSGRIWLQDESDIDYNVASDMKYLYFTAQISDGTSYVSRLSVTITTVDTSTVRKNEIVDNLESTASDAPLSANQGKLLKDSLDAMKSSGAGYKMHPVTKFGESRNGTITTVYSSEYCILDVEKYQGMQIIVNNAHSANGCSQIKDGNNTVLATFSGENTSVGSVTIPATAKLFVISNSFVKNPNFYISVPEGRVKNDGLLFGENFLFDYDEGEFSQFNGTVTPGSGLVLGGTGEANGLIVNKVIPLDNWSLIADVQTVDNNENIALGTKITQGESASHSTRVEVDLSGGTITIFNNSNGNQAAQENISSIVSGNIYTIKLERIDRSIKATLINRTSGASVSAESPDYAAGSGNEGINKAGKMFDSPIYYVGSGSPYLQNLYATCLRRAKVLFVGDSITGGAHTTYETSWAQMAAEYFGDSLTGGRGSGDVLCCLNELRSLLSVVKPKAVIVTIGTNYSSSVLKSGYTGLFKSIINIIKEYDAIPVINNVCACDARKTGLTIINSVVNELKQIGCRFDLATSINNDWDDGQNNTYYYTDKVHLNVAGNTLLYNIVTTQLGWLKNI